MENNINKFYCWIKREDISLEMLKEFFQKLPTKKENSRIRFIRGKYDIK